MKETILKKTANLVIFTGLILFSGIGQVKAQTVTNQPNFNFKLYAVDQATGKAITSTTKSINVGVIFTNDTPNSYPNIFFTPLVYRIYNQNQNGIWSSNVDTFLNPYGVNIEPQQRIPAFASCAIGLPSGQTELVLKNTSTKKGLVVSVTLNVNYNPTWAANARSKLHYNSYWCCLYAFKLII